MTVEKISLSLDADLVARARRVARHRGLSALVNDALRIKLQHGRLRTLLVRMDAEFGPVPAEVLDRLRATWPERGAAKRKPGRSALILDCGAVIAWSRAEVLRGGARDALIHRVRNAVDAFLADVLTGDAADLRALLGDQRHVTVIPL